MDMTCVVFTENVEPLHVVCIKVHMGTENVLNPCERDIALALLSTEMNISCALL